MKNYLLEKLSIACMMACAVMTAGAADIHVATTGSDDNAGTEAAPLLTIHKALELVKASGYGTALAPIHMGQERGYPAQYVGADPDRRAVFAPF